MPEDRGENASNRIAQDRYQHSGDTISRVFNNVLDAILKLYPKVVKQPSNDISQYAYVSILRGITHIHAHVPEHDLIRFRNRKGDISQNVLGICSFDELFCYVMASQLCSPLPRRCAVAVLAGPLLLRRLDRWIGG